MELLKEVQREPHPEPGSPQQFQIADVLQDVLSQSAMAYLKEGRLAKAETAYTEIGQVCETLLKEIDAKAEWVTKLKPEFQSAVQQHFQRSLEVSRAGRANNLCRLGRTDEAIPIFDGIVQRSREAALKSPEDANARDQLAMQLRNYGQYMLRAERTEDAARLLAESHDLTEKNFSANPTDAGLKHSYSYALYYLAVARDAQGLAPDALALFERSRAVRAELVTASADVSNKVDLILSEARIGNVDAAKALADELSASDKKDPDLRLDIARAMAQLTRRTEGDARDALRNAALDALDRCVEDGQNDPFTISTQPDLIPVRDDDRFRAIVAKLTESQGEKAGE
ncbi:MAG: hypothetical protein WKF77_00855 [Planctomycetaceae bacterium]